MGDGIMAVVQGQPMQKVCVLLHESTGDYY